MWDGDLTTPAQGERVRFLANPRELTLRGLLPLGSIENSPLRIRARSPSVNSAGRLFTIRGNELGQAPMNKEKPAPGNCRRFRRGALPPRLPADSRAPRASGRGRKSARPCSLNCRPLSFFFPFPRPVKNGRHQNPRATLARSPGAIALNKEKVNRGRLSDSFEKSRGRIGEQSRRSDMMGLNLCAFGPRGRRQFYVKRMSIRRGLVRRLNKREGLAAMASAARPRRSSQMRFMYIVTSAHPGPPTPELRRRCTNSHSGRSRQGACSIMAG